MYKLYNLIYRFIGLLFLAASFGIGLAVLSYNPTDPSFNHATNAEAHNILGIYGAHTADLCVQFIGYSTALIPIVLFSLGFKFVKGVSVQWPITRISALLIALILGAILSASWDSNTLILSGKGGYIGTFLLHELSFLAPFSVIAITTTTGLIALLYFALGLTKHEWRFITGYLYKSLKFTSYNLYRAIRYSTLYIISVLKRNPHVIEEQADVVPAAKVKRRAKKKTSLKQPKEAKQIRNNGFNNPSTDMLSEAEVNNAAKISESELEGKSRQLSKVLQDFGVKGDIIKINNGPVVTLYELEPSAGTKSARVIALADDIARSMSAPSARISVVLGKNALGIELPNKRRETVFLRELLESGLYKANKNRLPLVLGKDIAGDAVVADLAKMPHLLVAGTTGSGKSVAINAMILSLLYYYSPDQCKFVMVDPKMLELSVYEGIPHLLAPVVTEPKKAVSALKWVVKEMERRYKEMSTIGVRSIDGYNSVATKVEKTGKPLEKQVQTGFAPETGEPMYETVRIETEFMPYIVVIVDEMADLMLVAGKEIEALIQRLAQMARAAGIHIITATQRPSVDVITGVIKANFPTRISFQVTSKIDSRTILGEQGAEQLLGMGDMLYMSGGGKIERVHGPFVSDMEVEKVVSFLKAQGTPQYKEEITVMEEDAKSGIIDDTPNGEQNLYSRAVNIVLRDKRASTSYIQRMLKIGYNRAANLIEQMEREGVVSAPSHTGKREILKQES